jgi:diguanylate cyclase (GGDEF)-like protein
LADIVQAPKDRSTHRPPQPAVPVPAAGAGARESDAEGSTGSYRVLGLIGRLIDEFRGVVHLPLFLDRVPTILREELAFASCAIALSGRRRRDVSGGEVRVSRTDARIPHNHLAEQQVMETGKPLVLRAVPVHEGAFVGAYSGVYAPMISGGRTIGVISAERIGADACGDEDLQRLTFVSRYLAAAVEFAWTHAELRQTAATDHLTGLANRRALEEALEREIALGSRYGQSMSLVLIEVDQFKLINDGHGHLRGDAVLRAIGRILRGMCRETDLAARYGGDEFVLMLPNTSKSGATRLTERLRRRVPEAARRFSVPLTISAGIATLPEDGGSAVALLEVADKLMYQAKRLGGNRVMTA